MGCSPHRQNAKFLKHPQPGRKRAASFFTIIRLYLVGSNSCFSLESSPSRIASPVADSTLRLERRKQFPRYWQLFLDQAVLHSDVDAKRSVLKDAAALQKKITGEE
jgi:hypothetical protein